MISVPSRGADSIGSHVVVLVIIWVLWAWVGRGGGVRLASG